MRAIVMSYAAVLVVTTIRSSTKPSMASSRLRRYPTSNFNFSPPKNLSRGSGLEGNFGCLSTR
ncbi:hypothetical protein Y043_6065 [Burkholderia pseudomallei MSHR2138]|nr:hypothetical protein Y043_6065 [Burkholderia pseudomallei MSHR2138]